MARVQLSMLTVVVVIGCRTCEYTQNTNACITCEIWINALICTHINILILVLDYRYAKCQHVKQAGSGLDNSTALFRFSYPITSWDSIPQKHQMLRHRAEVRCRKFPLPWISSIKAKWKQFLRYKNIPVSFFANSMSL
jgi:hypothetical protein